jgi:glycogen debranching enzyme
LLRHDSTAALVEEIPETPFYIPATGSSTRPRRTLKHGDCFAVLDSHADIGASSGGPDGIFYCDTRHISHLEMLLNGKQPLLLGSSVRDDNSILTVDLSNPDIYVDQKLVRRTCCTSCARFFSGAAPLTSACASRITAIVRARSG